MTYKDITRKAVDMNPEGHKEKKKINYNQNSFKSRYIREKIVERLEISNADRVAMVSVFSFPKA